VKCVFDEFHFFAVGVVRHIHNGVFDAIGIGYLVKNESFPFAGALHIDITEIQDGWEKSLDFARRVLDAEEEYFAHVTDEKTALFDIDNPFAGDDPDIEVVVDPDEEAEKPEEDEKRIFDEEKERSIEISQEFGIEHSESDKCSDNDDETEDERDKLYENIEPVPMNHEENFFVGILSFEAMSFVEGSIGDHHRGTDFQIWRISSSDVPVLNTVCLHTAYFALHIFLELHSNLKVLKIHEESKTNCRCFGW
jgi:hypothetical protein